jgi:hypothetical protein
MIMSAQQKTLEERKAILAQQIQQAVARGGRIETQSDTMAVVVYGKPVNHVLHFLIGLFTFFLWWIVWIILAASGGEKREMITIDEFGNVLVQKLVK